MNKIKKTILTLVALLAVTTGAWADDTYTIKFEANGNSKTVENVTLPHTFSCDYSGENGELDQIIKQLYGLSGGCCSMNSPGASGNSNVTAGVNGDNQFITISAPFEGNATVTGAYFDAAGGYIDFDYSLTISCPGYDPNAGSSTPETETLLTTITATAQEQASYSTANMATVSFSYTAYGYSAYKDNWGWWGYGWIATVTAAEGYTITKCIFYDDANRTATDSESPFVVETTEEDKTPRINETPIDGGKQWSKGIMKIEVYGYVTPSASSGPEVAWDKAEKTGSFTMPGGNVTLEPEYYLQAALAAAPSAINDVPATTDGAIVNAGTVANIGSTETAQGTVMYYVSTTALDDAALLALAADKWTADVPTAQSLAQGQAYVYYYVRGNDSDNDEENFSDGDILAANALTVTIAAEPTYAVTFAEGVNPEPPAEPEWTASPNAGVKKGETVTVTYNGSKKVIGVKAEKKAATPSLNITSPVVGQVIGSDGKNYAYGSLPSGVTAVAKICYVSGSNGLALALTDEDGTMNWSTAQTTCAAHTPAFTGGTWKLATKDEWNNMINAAGSDNDLLDGFSSVGGTNMESGSYCSSTEDGSDSAWVYLFFESVGWSSNEKDFYFCVRAVLAF